MCPGPGLDFHVQRRTVVLDNHVARTFELAADVRAGRTPQPNLVIRPENSSDIDPFTNPDAYRRIQAVAEPAATSAAGSLDLDGLDRWEPGQVLGSAGGPSALECACMRRAGCAIPCWFCVMAGPRPASTAAGQRTRRTDTGSILVQGLRTPRRRRRPGR